MQIPFFDIKKVHRSYQQELENTVIQGLRKGNYINGEAIHQLEDTCKKFLNMSYAISCANGTDALSIAINSLELEKGSDVIIPSFNYVSSAESAVLLGLCPVFCDVDIETSNTTLKFIEEKITDNTKLVIITHLFGLPLDEIKEISAYCKSKNIYLIEDNAQSFGASLNDQMAGSFGDISTTSFFPTKNLGCAGDGGMIFTNNEKLGKRTQKLKSHGQSNKYEFDIPGYNSRLDTLQADILNLKIEHFEQQLGERKANSIQYLLHLGKSKTIKLPPFKDNTFNQFTVQVKNNLRNDLKQFLNLKGIQSMIYYPKPMHKQVAYKKDDNKELPNSIELSKNSLSLPIYPGLTSEEISYICSSILEFEKSFE